MQDRQLFFYVALLAFPWPCMFRCSGDISVKVCRNAASFFPAPHHVQSWGEPRRSLNLIGRCNQPKVELNHASHANHAHVSRPLHSSFITGESHRYAVYTGYTVFPASVHAGPHAVLVNEWMRTGPGYFYLLCSFGEGLNMSIAWLQHIVLCIPLWLQFSAGVHGQSWGSLVWCRIACYAPTALRSVSLPKAQHLQVL